MIFNDNGIKLELTEDTYVSGGNRYYGLVVQEDNEDKVFAGEPWCDVTVNLPELLPNEFALDNDFTSFNSQKLIKDILKEISDESIPHRYIPSGFVNFPVYYLKGEREC